MKIVAAYAEGGAAGWWLLLAGTHEGWQWVVGAAAIVVLAANALARLVKSSNERTKSRDDNGTFLHQALQPSIKKRFDGLPDKLPTEQRASDELGEKAAEPFCSAECQFNFTGQRNYPVAKPPKRGRRSDEAKHIYFHAHGLAYNNRQAAVRCCSRGELLKLVRERQNPVDKNAIRICRLEGQDLGYVPRELAAELAPKLDAGQLVRAEVDWINSPDEEFEHFGLKVRVGLLKQ